MLTQQYSYDLNKPSTSLEWYVEGLTAIVQEAKQNHIKIILVSPVNGYDQALWSDDRIPADVYWLYRWWYPIKPKDIDLWYSATGKRFKQIADVNAIPFADIVAAFPKDARYYAQHDKLHFDPGHYSPEGNRLLASLIEKYLEKAILPDIITER